jgi:hypothetical protein
MNVTATDTTANSFLTVYPDDAALPASSDINFNVGETIANMVTTGIGADGGADFYNHAGSVDVVADLLGYFTHI